MRKINFLLLALGFSILMPVQAQLPVPIAAAKPANPVATTTITAPASPSSGLLNGYVADDNYKLRVGDTVSFQILEDRLLGFQDIPVSLVVADSGELEVTYIGRIMAAGKTCKQVAEDIKTGLEKDYYKKATVVLSLNLANKILGRVYIWGQVRAQGPLDIQVNENLTAGNAILRAGGFADFASKTKVRVIRAASATGQKQTFDLNMEDILEKGKTEQDILLQPNDFIIVPTRLVNF
jgi:protein involved in polysaccharide export with SLBB domain